MHIGLTSLGIAQRATQSGPLGFVQPTLSDLAPYAGVSSVGGYTKYTNVPWGPCFGVEPWAEPTLGNQVVAPVMTIYMPNVAMPPGGYGLIVRAHANGSDHNITEGSGSLWTYLVEPAMAKGYVVATIEFRHPVSNVALGAPHTDTGYCLQFLRACSSALNINTNRIHGFAQSRGNLLLWQTVSADLADAGNVSFAQRQSSKIKSLWGLNTQDSYSTTEFILEKIVPADQAACLVDPAYADDVRWGSAKNLIKTGTQELPLLCSTYDNPFLNALPSHQVGQYTKAAIDANANLRVHCPEFGQALWKAYADRGQTSKITVCDDVSGGVVSMADCTTWFQIIDEEPGISAKSARVQAMQRRLGGTLHFLDNPAVGAYLSQATPTPITTVDTAFGVLIDGAWGAANRLNTSSPLGGTMVQSTATLRPVLKSLNMGRGFGFALDGVDDVFRIGLTNTTVDLYSFPILEAPIQGATSRTDAVVNVGIDKIANKTVSLIAAVPNTTFGTVDLKLLRQFALELSGEDIIDVPGAVVLADAAKGFLPVSYTRSGPALWCPQADGSLASFAANVVPREYSNGRWGFRFDPGWSQYAQWSSDLTNAAWGKTRCTAANVSFSHPLGGSVISKIIEDTSVNLSHLAQSTVTTSVAGVSYTARAVLYPDERKHAALCFTGGGGGTDRGIFVDLQTGAITGAFGAYPASYGATLRADGGVDLFITEAAPGAAGYAARVYVCSAQNISVYTGDGVSGLRVAVLNLTNTAYPVPLTVAQGTAGTVGNHSCSALLADLGMALGTEFSVGMEYTFRALATVSAAMQIDNNSNTDRVRMQAQTTDSSVAATTTVAGVGAWSQVATVTPGGLIKQAMRISSASHRLAANGALAGAPAAFGLPTGLTRVRIAQSAVGLQSAASVSKLWIAPSISLTDAELQTVTT